MSERKAHLHSTLFVLLFNLLFVLSVAFPRRKPYVCSTLFVLGKVGFMLKRVRIICLLKVETVAQKGKGWKHGRECRGSPACRRTGVNARI